MNFLITFVGAAMLTAITIGIYEIAQYCKQGNKRYEND